MSFRNSFVEAFNPAYRQGAQVYSQEQEQKRAAAIEEQKRKTQLVQQVTMEAGQYGVQPVVDQATGEVNVMATAAAATRAKALFDRMQRVNGTKDMEQLKNEQDATARGIPLSKPPTPPVVPDGQLNPGTGQPFVNDPQPQQVDLGRQVYQYDEDKRKADYERQRKVANDAELAKQRATKIDANRAAFGTTMGRWPTADELDANGDLTPVAMNAVQSKKTNALKGFVDDPNTPGGVMPIPGGPADLKQQALAEKADAMKKSEAAKEQALADTHANVLDNINAALPQIGYTTTGVIGGRTSGFNQSASDLHANLDAIKSGLGVDMLNQMRASSANGSTGIGRIMQVEFDAFSKAARNLDQKQSPEQLKNNLTALKTHLEKWQRAYQTQKGGGQPAPAMPAATPKLPAGWTIKP